MEKKNYEQSKKLDNVCYDIRGPVMDEAMRMEARGANILKLNIGNPAPFGFYAPDEVILDMIYNLRNCEGYSDSRGLFSARKAIMQYCQLKGIPNVGINDIFTGNGVSELITLTMQGLLDDGERDPWSLRRIIQALDGVLTLAGGQGGTLSLRRAAGLVPRYQRSSIQGHAAHEGHRRHQPEQPDRRALSEGDP